jgi:hypothetical protein
LAKGFARRQSGVSPTILSDRDWLLKIDLPLNAPPCSFGNPTILQDPTDAGGPGAVQGQAEPSERITVRLAQS